MPKNKKLESSGLLVVDKPLGVTSHDVVAAVRGALGMRRVGHAGTLDPQASGVLVVGFGHGTRLLNYIVDHAKTYEATIRLGRQSTTDDSEGEMMATVPVRLVEDFVSPDSRVLPKPADCADGGADGRRADVGGASAVRCVTRAQIETAINEHLTGDIEQVPSAYSAVRVDGRHAYELARAGKEVKLNARHITVNEFTVLDARNAFAEPGDSMADMAGEGIELSSVVATAGSTANDSLDGAGATSLADADDTAGRESASTSIPVVDVDVRISCSTGTYIRSLGRDLGHLLGVGGYLTRLRRTRVGRFDFDDQQVVARVVTAHTKPHTFTNREGVTVTRNKVVLDATPDELRQRAMTMLDAVRRTMPLVAITAEDAVNLRFGRRLWMDLAQAVAQTDNSGRDSGLPVPSSDDPIHFAAAYIPATAEVVAILEPVDTQEVKSALVFPASNS
jgi:tRNA pseudouridine55 synthase